jgi:flagellar assembly protein FliH
LENGLSAGQVEVFRYPGHTGAGGAPVDDAEDYTLYGDLSAAEQPEALAVARLRAEFEQIVVEEARKAFENGRERGRHEGRAAEREEQAGAISAAAEQRARQVRELVEDWLEERDRYMQSVEHEVVNLALAVAARILRRESLMDPLLLTGAVRVALGQLSDSTAVTLRVPGSELSLWTEAVALLPNLARRPAVIAGEGMRAGECRIETELGSVDLGMRAQLEEIERGFFDRSGAGRPRADAPVPSPAETA